MAYAAEKLLLPAGGADVLQELLPARSMEWQLLRALLPQLLLQLLMLLLQDLKQLVIAQLLLLELLVPPLLLLLVLSLAALLLLLGRISRQYGGSHS